MENSKDIISKFSLEDRELLRKSLLDSTRHFISVLKHLNKKSLQDEKFLKNVAGYIKELAAASLAAKNIPNRKVDMMEEDLTDAGEIIQNILTQPLAISDTVDDDITFLSSAIQFNEKGVAYSCFNAVLEEFLEYPESTNTLLTELDFIVADLEKYSR